jgi:hypothetical protein
MHWWWDGYRYVYTKMTASLIYIISVCSAALFLLLAFMLVNLYRLKKEEAHETQA